MTRDPFLRLALIAACSLYMAAVAEASRRYGWPAGLLILLFGFGAAFFLSIDWVPDPDAPERPRSESARWRFPGLPRLSR